MANLAKIKVLFFCNRCGMTYMAIQERSKGSGRFECGACRHLVYEWSGSYDYVVWEPVNLMRDGFGTAQ
jgi:ribosomal protein S27AE